ncbi:MAG: lytic murein transglycosylase [Rubrobacteraceae bacterium]
MKVCSGFIVLLMTVLFAGVAGAQTQETTGPGAKILALEAQSTEQDAALAQGLEEISAVGSSLQEAQTQANAAQVRSQELEGQARALEGQLAGTRKNFERSRSLYEEQATAAYKGRNLEGMTSVIGIVLGKDGDVGDLADGRIARVLSDGRLSLGEYQDSQRKLKNTVLQVSEKKTAYDSSVREERRRNEALRQREEKLETAVSRVRDDRVRTDSRIQALQGAERARILRAKPANGGPSVQRRSELRIAREDIVARPVKPISKKRYKKLYKKSAEKYGFGKDWYILAAVGKVESDHGENMGPSSAGAMGPMQFMPSTWKTSGVDGNGDGVANVMDPRDAIPAAARYLKTGGAPKDWYAALFSYNHADWYVKKVLGVAEGYRRLADDDRTGPYS